MAEFDIEMQYFKKDVKRIKGVDVNIDTIKSICTKHGVECKIKEKTPGNLPMVSTTVISKDPENLKGFAKEIMQLYGKPELPAGLFAGAARKQGIEAIKGVLAEVSA
jgi:transaldolase